LSAFEEIIEELKADPRNQTYTEAGIPPIFQASDQARILIIGQAPGRKVEESGIPFNDKKMCQALLRKYEMFLISLNGAWHLLPKLTAKDEKGRHNRC
jgi:uracil-DNA glycosylase